MSRVTDDFGYDGYDEEDVNALLKHAMAIEEAMTILIDIVKTEKPSLDLSNFTKLLD